MTETVPQPAHAAAATHETPPVGLCWECNYALQGLAEPRCPECGRGFDPEDPASMNLGKPMGPLAKRLLRPATWYGPVVFGYVAIALLASALLPMNRWAAVQTFFAFWTLLGLPYFVRAGLRHAVVSRYRQPSAAARVDDPMVRHVGRVTLGAALLLFAQVPLYLSLFVSMPWLNALAQERYEQLPFVTVNGLPLEGHQYGLFRVVKVDVNPHGAELYLWWRRYDAPTLRYAPGEGNWSKVILGAQLTPSWNVE